MILAGIDEAGYGPLLGPLVVSATAFELPGAVLPTQIDGLPCLWKLLRAAITKKTPITKGRLIIADSKIVHHLADGTRHLERGVLAMLRTMAANESHAAHPSALLEQLGCRAESLGEHPWYAAYQNPLPWLCDAGDIAITGNMLRTAMARAEVKIVAMRTQLLPERAFNRLVGGTRNKATTLVSITLGHLHYLHQNFGSRGLVVGVDKQGGRDHYTNLLLQTFPEAQLKVLLETPQASTYLIQERTTAPSSTADAQRSVLQTVVHFREKGEAHFMPTALASMVCKYLRELYMHGFNTWWCRHIDGLRPTAGYYQDGQRWMTDVEPHLLRLGVARHDLVRCR